MTTRLERRIGRLEERLAPDPDDPFGLRVLSLDEARQFDRFLEASGGDVASGAAQIAPKTAAKISLILDRAHTHGAEA